MAVEKFPLVILGGLNDADSEDVLQGEVRDSFNFLFQHGESINRPGLRAESANATRTGAFYAHSERMWNGSRAVTAVLGTAGSVNSLDASNQLTALTGAGTSFENAGYARIASVNGVILVASNTGGMIRWDPNGTSYTIMGADSKYRYLTSHLTRVIGAYYLDTGFAGYSRRVGWSHQGDETVWTPAASNSANYNILNDAPDDITGVGMIRNLVVVFRRTGFHFASPTGIASPTYRFESFSRDGVGCCYPHTLAVEDSMAIFVGPDDVYVFDGRTVEPIGYKIRRTLFKLLRQGAIYHGFFSRYSTPTSTSATGDLRMRYNLFPMITPAAPSAIDSSAYPHFVYDVLEGKWSKQFYNYNTVLTAFNHIRSQAEENLSIYTGNGSLYSWDPSVACETASTLRTGNVIIGEIDQDIRVQRVLVRHRDLSSSTPTLTAYSSIGRLVDSASNTFNAGGGDGAGRWIRAWCTLEKTGQDFFFDLLVPAGVQFSTNRWLLKVSENADFRGDEYAY